MGDGVSIANIIGTYDGVATDFRAKVGDITWVTDAIRDLEKELQSQKSLNAYAARVAGISGVGNEEYKVVRALKVLNSSIGKEYLTPMEKLRRTLDELRAEGRLT